MNLFFEKEDLISEIFTAVNTRAAISGITHTFYRYPARFSNLFARTMINLLTKPGDLVFDPYMGGGTSLVEARLLGRRAIGIDVSSLATFIARVKTTPLSDVDIAILAEWSENLEKELNIRNSSNRPYEWIENGYQRNLNRKRTWPIRKILELAITYIEKLPSESQRQFARCVLLNTGQWALDCRKEIPSSREFRKRLLYSFSEMIRGAKEFTLKARDADRLYDSKTSYRTLCLNRSVIGIENDPLLSKESPNLIVTSPPYPGVYMLYHRWKVQGRWETPAPFWVANSMDGRGMSYYTLGDRKQKNLEDYFTNLQAAFMSLSSICKKNTWLVQMVGFSDPGWQLSRYLEILCQCGFCEIKFRDHFDSLDGRIWRAVPSRKWYATYQDNTKNTAKEVVLFHKKV